MCGFIAAFGWKPSSDVRARAVAGIAHRGPDDQREWTSETGNAVWIAHTRLSILDLSDAGSQPYVSRCGRYVLAYNGEIYNFGALREELRAAGVTFRSNSDTEVVLEAYLKWGRECVERLNGMFAFVVWDKESQSFLAARDPIGIKPLYLHHQDGKTVFASEATVLNRLLPGERKINPTAMAHVLSMGYVPHPMSIWAGIDKVEPGSVVHGKPGQQPQVWRYWTPPNHDVAETHSSSQDWSALFEKTVSDHMVSDVPVQLFLSGGLDSSSMALALKSHDEPLHAFTLGAEDDVNDREVDDARDLAKSLGYQHSVVRLKEDNLSTLLRCVASASDEPQGYGSLLNVYALCKSASENTKVALSGDGADELLGGYTWYQNLEIGGTAIPAMKRRLGGMFGDRPMDGESRQARVSAYSQQSVLHRHHFRMFGRFLPEEVSFLLRPTNVKFNDDTAVSPLRRYFNAGLPLRLALRRVDLMTFCADHALPKIDRMSMAHSLEVRVPFLDKRVIEWSFAHPDTEADEPKSVLRNYLRGRLSDDALARKKRGFSLRATRELDEKGLLDLIDGSPLVKDGYWNSDWRRVLGDDPEPRRLKVWSMAMLAAWATAHLGGREGR